MGRAEKINRFLGNRGLATMDDPRGLFEQLGAGIKDHDCFRKMLTKVEPEKRTIAYETMRQFLPFKAKPLHEYLSESAMEAELQRLPVIDGQGNLTAYEDYKPYAVTTQDSAIQPTGSDAPVGVADSVRRGIAEEVTFTQDATVEFVNKVLSGKLVLTCSKCTRQEDFFAPTKRQAAMDAIRAGWVRDEDKKVCPKCPAVRT